MSTQLRDILIAVTVALALLAVLWQRAHQAAPGAETPAKWQPFPDHVVAHAEPLPQFADGGWSRVQQRVASLNGMWSQLFQKSGDDYSAPRVVQRAVEEEACGAPSEGWAGLYCPAGRTLVIDLDAHAQRHGVIGQGFSELLLGYIVAHEMGHHVQTLRGAPDTHTLENARQHELHAECLAGVWGRAAGVPLPPAWAYAEDAVHGTVQEQIQWLNAGYRSGRPADCDAIWSGSTSP